MEIVSQTMFRFIGDWPDIVGSIARDSPNLYKKWNKYKNTHEHIHFDFGAPILSIYGSSKTIHLTTALLWTHNINENIYA